MAVTFFTRKQVSFQRSVICINIHAINFYLFKNVQFNINKIQFYVLLIQGISDIRWGHDKYHVSVHCDKRC